MRNSNIHAWTLVGLLAVASILAYSSSASAQYWHWRSHNHASGYSGPAQGSSYTGQTWSPYSGSSVYSPSYGAGGLGGAGRYTGYSYYPGYSLSSGLTPDGVVIGTAGAPYYYGGRYYYSSPTGGNLLR